MPDKKKNAHRSDVQSRISTENLKTTTARKDKRKKYENNKRLATWNVRSSNIRDQEICQVLKERRIDVCVLQEQRKKQNEQSK